MRVKEKKMRNFDFLPIFPLSCLGHLMYFTVLFTIYKKHCKKIKPSSCSLHGKNEKFF